MFTIIRVYSLNFFTCLFSY